MSSKFVETKTLHEMYGTSSDKGIKYDAEKPDFSLMPPISLTAFAQVLTYGKKKYAAHNWRNGLDQARLISSAMRHLTAYLGGQTNDPESGLPHMAHVMCNAAFALELHDSVDCIDTRHLYSAEGLESLTRRLEDSSAKH
jgi:hypothetical protein